MKIKNGTNEIFSYTFVRNTDASVVEGASELSLSDSVADVVCVVATNPNVSARSVKIAESLVLSLEHFHDTKSSSECTTFRKPRRIRALRRSSARALTAITTIVGGFDHFGSR